MKDHLRKGLLNNRFITYHFVWVFLFLSITEVNGQEGLAKLELKGSTGINLTRFKQKRVLLGQSVNEGTIERFPFFGSIPLTLGFEYKRTVGVEFEYSTILFSGGSSEKRYRIYCLTNPNLKVSPVLGISYYKEPITDARVALSNDTTIYFPGIGFEFGLKAKKFKFDVILYSFLDNNYEPLNEFVFPISSVSFRVSYQLFRAPIGKKE